MRLILSKAKVICVTLTGMLFLCGFSQAETSRQPVKTSRSIGDPERRSLSEVLNELKTRYKVHILFSDQQVQGLNIHTDLVDFSAGIEENLGAILAGTGLKFRKAKKNSFLITGQRIKEESARPRPAEPSIPSSYQLVVPVPPPVIATEREVKGTVKDEKGEGLPGVSILVKGTQQGTITETNGAFSIEVPDEHAVLVFSFVGYVNQEVAVGNRTLMEVAMLVDEKSLEEVVVVGYGQQNKKEVTGAVASVSSENFIQGNVGDAAQLIQGKVAGLTVVTPTGDPSKNSQILLRGTSTLATSTQPLILVDGIPGDLNTLAQDDIESIDVLKDGSAAAIYGTRGTNGVILITSRKNKGQIQPTIQYNGYISTEEFVRIPRMLNAAEYRARIAGGAAFSDLGSETDWIKEISNKLPVTQYHNLSLRGGSVKTSYMASLNYRDSPGMILNYDFNTLNSRVDLNHNMFDDRLKINFNFISNNNKRNVDFDQIGQGLSDSPPSAIFNSALWRNPTAPAKNADGTWNEEPSISYYENPLALLHETYGGFKSTSSRTSGSAIWEPIENLLLKGLYSIENYSNRRSQGHTKQHLSTIKDGLEGYASKSSELSTTRLLELTADYSRYMNSHEIRALVGYGYQDNIWETESMRNWGFPAGNFSYPDNIGVGLRTGLGGSNLMSSQKYASNLISFFGRVNYNYADKYLLMASLRYEGSSKFVGTDKPWGMFPAISAGWRIHEEDFLKGSTLINQLKLRIGYGITGTAPDQYFLGVPMLGYQGSFLINGNWVPSLSPSRNPNPSLRWEEKKETNIGLDFEILDRRINGSIDYYERVTDGLLYDFSVPTPPNPYRTTKANVGVMKNKGMEVLINFIPLQNRKITWNSTVTFSTNSNTLVSLSNDLYKTTNPWFNAGSTGSPISTYTHRVEVGKEIGNFYGYKVIDITEDGKWIYENKNGEASSTRAEEDKKILGNGLPKYYAGWNNSFQYGNFDLSMTMRGAFGFQILNFQRMYYGNPGNTLYNQLLSANDKIFGKAALNPTVPVEYNSYYVENGDYWKIDNVKFGYNVKMPDNKHIRRAYVYVSTLNTFMLTKYKGMDPEVNQLGLTPGNDERHKYPSTRAYSLGVSLTIN